MHSILSNLKSPHKEKCIFEEQLLKFEVNTAEVTYVFPQSLPQFVYINAVRRQRDSLEFLEMPIAAK